jgi:hypothetical protein
MVMEKTMAWFRGAKSSMSSHMAASTRVNFLGAAGDERLLLSCGNAGEERKKLVKISTKRNLHNLHLIVIFGRSQKALDMSQNMEGIPGTRHYVVSLKRFKDSCHGMGS